MQLNFIQVSTSVEEQYVFEPWSMLAITIVTILGFEDGIGDSTIVDRENGIHTFKYVYYISTN